MSLLRVVSYNIHKGRSVSGRDSLADLRLSLHGLRPDVVFLQEVQGRNEINNGLHAQHESIAAALKMQVAYGRNAIRERTDHGNALLSHHAILDFENQDISDHVMEQRGLLHGVLAVGETKVHCFVVHLGLFAASRVRQIELIVDRIKRMVPDGAPVLIAGDFNDWNDKLAPLFVAKLGVYEVFAHAPSKTESTLRLRDLGHSDAQKEPPPRTFPAAFPFFRLDRIYQRGFAVRSAKVLKGKPWTQLSDHAPIFAELELP